jgi:hypothetical protein
MEITERGLRPRVTRIFSEFVVRLAVAKLTTVVLAITTYLGDMRLLGFLAVFAAILAVLFGRTITSGMCAFICLVLCHKTTLLSG